MLIEFHAHLATTALQVLLLPIHFLVLLANTCHLQVLGLLVIVRTVLPDTSVLLAPLLLLNSALQGTTVQPERSQDFRTLVHQENTSQNGDRQLPLIV